MGRLLANDSHFNLILKMSIGNGDSITKSSEVAEEPKDRDEKMKDAKEKDRTKA
jgi:hypothetical protein